MKNLKELNTLVYEKEKISEYIEKVKTIGYICHHGDTIFIGITQHNNLRYTFGGIEKIIGQDKLNGIIRQFEGLITVELHRAKEAKDKELSLYSVAKSEF